MTDGINVVSLETAILCVDCETISTSIGTRCYLCGSSALLSLSRILGGPLRANALLRGDGTEYSGGLVDELLASVEKTFSSLGERGL